jgi:molecular chaperone GrpE (heat shock protein)
VEKVERLEQTLREEHEGRLRVQKDLERLEKLLEEKLSGVR